jgi:hypothetical protein
VNQRKCQHDVWPRSLGNGHAFVVCPPNCGRRVREIEQQRQQAVFLCAAQLAVAPLDAGGVDVEGRDLCVGFGCQAAIDTGVWEEFARDLSGGG